MTAMTKTQMVNACVDYETDWFFDREPAEQREVFRHIQLHGFRGFINYPDDALFAACVHNGTLLGEFDTKHEAELDAQKYMYQTGNAAYIEEVSK